MTFITPEVHTSVDTTCHSNILNIHHSVTLNFIQQFFHSINMFRIQAEIVEFSNICEPLY